MFHALTCVIRLVPNGFNHDIAAIISLIPVLPIHPGLCRTTTMFIGIYAKYVVSSPQLGMLQQMLQLVMSSLAMPQEDEVFPMRSMDSCGNWPGST